MASSSHSSELPNQLILHRSLEKLISQDDEDECALEFLDENEIIFDDRHDGFRIIVKSIQYYLEDLILKLLELGVIIRGKMKNTKISLNSNPRFFEILLPHLNSQDVGYLLRDVSRYNPICEIQSKLIKQGYYPDFKEDMGYVSESFLNFIVEYHPNWFHNLIDGVPSKKLPYKPFQLKFLMNRSEPFNYSGVLISYIYQLPYNIDEEEVLNQVTLLIQLGADVNYENATAYIDLVMTNKYPRVEDYFVNHGLNFNIAGQALYSRIHSVKNHNDFFQRCLAMGVDVNLHPGVISCYENNHSGWFSAINEIFSHGLTNENFIKFITEESFHPYGTKNLVQIFEEKNIPLTTHNNFLLVKFVSQFRLETPSENDFAYLQKLLNAGCYLSSSQCVSLHYILKRHKATEFYQTLFNGYNRRETSFDSFVSQLQMINELDDGHLADFPNRSYEDDYLVIKGSERIDYIYAIFDGHGKSGSHRSMNHRSNKGVKFTGSRIYISGINHMVHAAIYGVDSRLSLRPLHVYIEYYINQLEDPCVGVEDAIKKAFVEFDRDALYNNIQHGCCVTMIISVMNVKYVVNLGDSRTLIVNSDKELIFVTDDHDEHNPGEVERVLTNKGFIQSPYIMGLYMISRALGDIELKKAKDLPFDNVNGIMISVPEVFRLELKGSAPHFAILTSDAPYGMDAEFDNNDIVELFNHFKDDPQCAVKMAEVIAPHTTDDLTILILNLL